MAGDLLSCWTSSGDGWRVAKRSGGGAAGRVVEESGWEGLAAGARKEWL